MLKSFSEALDAGFIQPAVLWNNKPFIVNDVQYYEATGDGVNMLVGRYHALGDRPVATQLLPERLILSNRL